ncbi:efflux transporter outer membrane subunit [Dentiradicibacter hellwigii]|uniref:Efflux transporter outer membrane subunit n=1 Tax=Dentiradicibacter hellwigii TaxID=3149053 RepID=A0ABV4UBZ4_9RHOO
MKNDALIRRFSPGASLSLVLALAGCAVGPDYVRPDIAVPAQYKVLADAPEGWPGWKPAQPADDMPRGRWWERFGDAHLNALAEQVDISNQNVRAAEARFRQAQSALDQARAAWFPDIGGNAASTRSQSASSGSGDGSSSGGGSGSSTGAAARAIRTTHRLSLSVNWELDVWGRIQRSVEAGEAKLAASAADLRTARLSAQLLLVQSYLRARVVDAQRSLLEKTVAAYQRALEITRNRFAAGVAGRLDVAQAEAQLKSVQAQLADLGIQRAQYEHAIAVLIGKAPADFSLMPHAVASPPARWPGGLPALPEIPPGLPSALIERRPDIAAAERRVAAANAEIGVAQAAFFPSVTLGGSGGYQGPSLSNLLTLPNRFWSLGPALAMSLFDAGGRSAAKARASAAYDESVAAYRQTVLAGFQEVEDALMSLRLLAEAAGIQGEAVRAAAEALQIADDQYLAGTVSYLNVVSAQAASLNAERSAIDIAGRRLLAAAALIKALGGDWSPAADNGENAGSAGETKEAGKADATRAVRD